jgi:5-formyltetrahydrofolate cyclo-ligase
VTRIDDGNLGPKAELRARLLRARRDRSAQEIAAARAAITGLALERAAGASRVAAYQPLNTEPGSLELLDGLRAARSQVLVPVLLESRDLDWTEWGAPSVPFGVDAITTATLVFVPALAVDGQGRRLGRGGGSYDRALARVAAGVPVVALIYDDELLDEVPVDAWDRPVSGALSPNGWHWF